MKHKKKFKELSFEEKCSIIESMSNPHEDADYRSMLQHRRNSKLRKDTVKRNALSAIMKMRNINQ